MGGVPVTAVDLLRDGIQVQVGKADNKQTIQLKDVSEGHRTLGAWKTVDGNSTEQQKMSREK